MQTDCTVHTQTDYTVHTQPAAPLQVTHVHEQNVGCGKWARSGGHGPLVGQSGSCTCQHIGTRHDVHVNMHVTMLQRPARQ
eukprot:302521-Rhodomonas_salina.1